jgi:hypothetical protein
MTQHLVIRNIQVRGDRHNFPFPIGGKDDCCTDCKGSGHSCKSNVTAAAFPVRGQLGRVAPGAGGTTGNDTCLWGTGWYDPATGEWRCPTQPDPTCPAGQHVMENYQGVKICAPNTCPPNTHMGWNTSGSQVICAPNSTTPSNTPANGSTCVAPSDGIHTLQQRQGTWSTAQGKCVTAYMTPPPAGGGVPDPAAGGGWFDGDVSILGFEIPITYLAIGGGLAVVGFWLYSGK